MFTEKLNLKPIGIVDVDKTKNGIVIESKTYKNRIVDNSRYILRDLLLSGGVDNQLFYLDLGDMNMQYGDDVTNLPPAVPENGTLVHSFFTAAATSKIAVEINNRPGVKLSFVIPAEDANDDNMAYYNKLITELGFQTHSGRLFARLVVPIIKTRDIGLNISWTIIM